MPLPINLPEPKKPGVVKNGALAFIFALVFLSISSAFCVRMVRSSIQLASKCDDGYKLTSEIRECRIPVIATYCFLGSAGLAILSFCVGLKQRRDLRPPAEEQPLPMVADRGTLTYIWNLLIYLWKTSR
jgi:uncharacterized membrane protein